MSKKEYRMMIVSMLSVLYVLSFSGCGAEDKALILSPRSAAETGAEAGVVHVSGDDAVAEAVSAATVIYVHVCGAVVSPGVVELPAGSRAVDALEAAGGLACGAAENFVNLAAGLEDGQQLYFPTGEEAAHLGSKARESELARQHAQAGIVNINIADAALLCTLPGIGEVRAQAVIDYREQQGPFQKIEDIMRVPGIKESAYEKICDKIAVD